MWLVLAKLKLSAVLKESLAATAAIQFISSRANQAEIIYQNCNNTSFTTSTRRDHQTGIRVQNWLTKSHKDHNSSAFWTRLQEHITATTSQLHGLFSF